LSPAAPAFGQIELEKFERQLEQIQRETQVLAKESIPLDQRLLFDYGFSLSLSFATIDDPNQETHILRQTALTGFARLDIDGVHQLFVRSHALYRDFNSGDAFDSHGDDWVEPTLDRATYQFDWQRYLGRYEGKLRDGNLVLLAGRQLVHWANGLTLSEDIDGGLVQVSSGDVTCQMLAGTTRESITDLDSSRPGFNGDTHREFYGVMMSLNAGEFHKPYLYGLIQEDSNDDVSRTDFINGAPVTTRFGYDSWYIGLGSNGRLSDRVVYRIEAVYEGGRSRSNSFEAQPVNIITAVTQTREQIDAFALDAHLDYLCDDPNRTRVSAEVLVASGDDDRLTTTNTLGGNQPGTDDHAFNAFGLISTGLAFSPNVSNLLMWKAGIATHPMSSDSMFDHLELGADLLVFCKFNPDAPIDEDTGRDSNLGFESDFFANWRMTSDLSLAVRYGVFIPGSAISTDKDPRHFLFTGVTLTF
jgi:hypothetical protein